MQTRDDAMRYADAVERAREISDKPSGVVAKVGSHRTNGRMVYQVNVTHEPREGIEARKPYTEVIL